MAALLKIGIVFFAILFCTFNRASLWLSLLVATVLLGLLFHLPVATIAMDLLSAAWDPDTLLLVGALVAILFFSNLLKETGRMDTILEGFRHLLKDVRVVIALLPAIIGLVPITGGALVSAPMVVPGCDELSLSSERRTFINYWFRHIWEFTLPTFPPLVLGATLMGIPIRRFCWINLPLTLAAIAGGIVVGYWGVAKSLEEDGGSSNDITGWVLLKNLLPLLFALILVIVFKVELVYAFGLAIVGMVLFFRIGGEKVLKGFKESVSLELLLTVVIVMGFKKILESSQAIPLISATLSSSGVPKWLIAMSVTLLIGVITGFTIAPIAIGFPILIPLFQNVPGFPYYMMLAFAGGISGVMLSPLHLCLVLTREFFEADWKGVYWLVWFPVVVLLVVGLSITFFTTG